MTPGAIASRPAAVADVGERALIARIRERLAPSPAWLDLGVGDDAAVWQPDRNRRQVVTVDACVDGVHVDRRFTPPAAIGHRALAMSLSDLAAMGAAPRFAVLSLALPPDLPLDDFDGLIDGFLALAVRARVHLAGGNITSTSGPLVADVTAVGAVHPRRVLTRGGARPGDHVYVSGTLGDARAGLAACREDPAGAAASEAAHRYLWPEPRVRLGELLGRNRAASSCMDLSDGLADGLRQVAAASGAGLEIDLDALPVGPAAAALAARTGRDARLDAVAGGDDYELLFTVPRRRRGALAAVARLVGDLPLTRIGVVSKTPGVRLRDAGGAIRELPESFEHFAGPEGPR